MKSKQVDMFAFLEHHYILAYGNSPYNIYLLIVIMFSVSWLSRHLTHVEAIMKAFKYIVPFL